jgi:two-component system cell cycle response regulator
MDERTRQILEELADGRIPREDASQCEYSEELVRLVAFLEAIRNHAMALGQGDLSHRMSGIRGPVAGSLKALQANLRHLTWQTQRIAAGDFTQRVDFLGDFSAAFNTMVEQLDRSRAELVHASTRDRLTGLYNRSYFDTEFERIQLGRSFPVSFLVADINGLKEANDRRGHAFGDLLLKKCAELLRVALRGDDVIARIGGDEFAALLPRVDNGVACAIEGRVRELLATQEEEPLVSFAIGAGTALDPSGMRQALKEADDRMYLDKVESNRKSRSGVSPGNFPAPAVPAGKR